VVWIKKRSGIVALNANQQPLQFPDNKFVLQVYNPKVKKFYIPIMQFKQIWANLAVQDTKRTEKFYTHLGFRSNTATTTPELTSFLFSDNSFVIHFFRRDKLEFAMNGNAANSDEGSEVMFSLSAKSEEEVDNWAKNALQAGGTIIKKASRHEDGFYYCVFADPDGHRFNTLYIEEGM
jgi:predicted lactoylglutathione lyase